MIHSVKKSYRGKKSKRSIKRTRKTRQRKLKGGFKVSDMLTKMRGINMVNMLKEAVENFKSITSIAPTIRYIILKYRQRQLKCKNRFWFKKSTTNDDLEETTKTECANIQSEIDKLKETHSVASRRAILYSPIGAILTMRLISFWHNKIYVLNGNNNAIRRYLFTNCSSLTEDNSTSPISEADIQMIKDGMVSNAEKIDTVVKQIGETERNDEDGTILEENNDDTNVASSLTSQAQLLYDSEKERFPNCDNMLSAYEHQILLDYRAQIDSQNPNILKGGARCSARDKLSFLAIFGTGLGLMIGGLTPGTLALVIPGVVMIVLGGLGIKVCETGS